MASESEKELDEVVEGHDDKFNTSDAAEAGEAAEDDGLRAFKDPDPASREWKNRQRTLVVCSRGIAGRFRHLVEDLTDMLPNTKKESKLDRKSAKDVIDDLCFELSCNNYLFFEQHKQKDLFMWACKSPSGPSIKFLVSNIHTT